MFESDKHRAAFDRVVQWLQEIAARSDMIDRFELDDQDPIIGLACGSIFISVEILPCLLWTNSMGEYEDAMIYFEALVIESPPTIDVACLYYLLELNADMGMAAFAINESESITLVQTVPYSFCHSSDEIEVYLGSLINNIDDHAEEIAVRCGISEPDQQSNHR